MSQKIVVIDDELETVRLVGLLLEEQGYTIRAALSADEGLAKVESEDPDLVILDVGLPDTSGFEVCRQIRSESSTANVPIMMFTAAHKPDDRVAAFEAGADDFITKPVHPTEMIARVRAMLLRSERQREATELTPKAKTFAFIGAKGGVGTTTVATNVAIALAQDESRDVIMAEMHTGPSTVAYALGLRGQPGLTGLLTQPAEELSSQIVQAELREKQDTAFLCAQFEPGEQSLSTAHVEAVTQHLRAMCDTLVLDLGTGLSAVSRHVLPACYHAVLVLEPTEACLAIARHMLSQMVKTDMGRHQISLLLVRRASVSTAITKDAVESELGHALIGVVPPAGELIVAGEGTDAVVSRHPNSAVAKQLELVATYLSQI